MKAEIGELLRGEPKLPGKRVRELITEDGYEGSKTILDDYLREVRPLYLRPRTYQRTRYRPGELCQFDVRAPKAEIPVGHCQTRPGYVLTGALGWSRAAASALVFSKQAPDLIWGIARCLEFVHPTGGAHARFHHRVKAAEIAVGIWISRRYIPPRDDDGSARAQQSRTWTGTLWASRNLVDRQLGSFRNLDRCEEGVGDSADQLPGEGTHRTTPLDRPRLRLVGLH